MNEIKLKPCPFCGGEARLIQIKDQNHKFWADGLYYIEVKHAVDPPGYICPLYSHSFGHYGGGYDKKAERYSDVTIKAHKACEEWNRRTEDEREGKADC